MNLAGNARTSPVPPSGAARRPSAPLEEVGERTRRRILFPGVPGPKSVENRLHVDIQSSGDDSNAIRDGLTRTVAHRNLRLAAA